MASLRKIKSTWQLSYYVDGKRCYKHFSPGTPKSIIKAVKKDIESKITLHKLGVKRFSEGGKGKVFITLRELNELVTAARKNQVDIDTLKRNQHAMRNFMEFAGPDIQVSDLKSKHFREFREHRRERALGEYARKGWALDEGKVKRGVNKDLANIRTVLRAGANLINDGDESILEVPPMEFYVVDRKRSQEIWTEDEIIAIANQLNNEARLAFWIIRYTGARRSEIVRRRIGEDNLGLKWKHIDWLQNTIRLHSKKRKSNGERFIAIHPRLRGLLLDRKAELGEFFDPDDHVIHLIRDTLTTYFTRARKRAGINKPCTSVHVLRHTAGTAVQRATGNIRVTQEFLGHSQITTTEIYAHIAEKEIEEAVNIAFQ